VFGPIEKLTEEMWPGTPVVPIMAPWATDSARLRRAGIPAFGVSGVFAEADSGNAHGANEQLSAESFYASDDFLYRLLKMLTSGTASR
jgi:acetylornithine deacetylase/succinyl-diaminopimelate desuccinylase-like protein